MSRGKRNRSWIRERQRDEYVQSAKRVGYRSRAAYKLIQLDERDRFFKRGYLVVDLGAAPGGWSQVAASRIGDNGRVLAVDLLPLAPLAGVEFIQGDFLDDSVANRLRSLLGAARADVVMSDMAPNISGIRDADQARALDLALGALTFAEEVIKPSGTFVVKAFHGESMQELMDEVRRKFASVAIRKPGASRDRSREIYLLARGYSV
ncbi:MAG: RlmE family RNA methyltransferase [Gammaproteobacteria bacterium]|nr:RlmE family RNA methyltransferase [Gammaproteobacteria bacterium]MDH3412029.1 RlmE family RNA methyltransferase [Gammaproteobacteria bacterium]